MHAAEVIAASCEAFLPSLCLNCGQPLGGRDVGLCGDCWSFLVPRVGSFCQTCAGPTAEPLEGCLECAHRPPPQLATVVWGEYDGVLRTAVLALKHRGRDELAHPLGALLAARVCLEGWAMRMDRVVHVPSHPLRRQARGRSAARELADVVAAHLGLPRVAGLKRRGWRRQVERSRTQRLRLPRTAFAPGRSVAGAGVLLVDDVLTTGATLARATEVLLAAGAREVACAALARTPDPRRST